MSWAILIVLPGVAHGRQQAGRSPRVGDPTRRTLHAWPEGLPSFTPQAASSAPRHLRTPTRREQKLHSPRGPGLNRRAHGPAQPPGDDLIHLWVAADPAGVVLIS